MMMITIHMQPVSRTDHLPPLFACIPKRIPWQLDRANADGAAFGGGAGLLAVGVGHASPSKMVALTALIVVAENPSTMKRINPVL